MTIHGRLVAYLRVLLLGMFLVGGSLIGMPCRPEEIEKHMRSMSEAEVVQILEDESQASGEPPT